MTIKRVLIFGHILALSLAFSTAAQEAPRYVFQIPEYPGMEPFNRHSSSLNLLHSPFAIVTRVYKTKDNSPLDKEHVIAFFSNALTKKGWIKGISERKGDDPYLSLRTQVYQSSKHEAYVHVAGEFYLWIAPKDGMYTVFMRQWRISRPDQQSTQQVARIIEALEGTDKAITFDHETLKVYSDSGWEQDHENEYLVGRELFTVLDKAFQNTPHGDPRGTLSISILTYRDAETAKAEMDRRKTPNGVSPLPITSGQTSITIPLPVRGHEAIITIGKNVVIIKDHSSQQQKRVENIADRLKQLLK